jgi:hypothetical protein
MLCSYVILSKWALSFQVLTCDHLYEFSCIHPTSICWLLYNLCATNPKRKYVYICGFSFFFFLLLQLPIQIFVLNVLVIYERFSVCLKPAALKCSFSVNCHNSFTKENTKFEILVVVTMKMNVFWDVMPYNLAVFTMSVWETYGRKNCRKLCAWCNKQPQKRPS